MVPRAVQATIGNHGEKGDFIRCKPDIILSMRLGSYVPFLMFSVTRERIGISNRDVTCWGHLVLHFLRLYCDPSTVTVSTVALCIWFQHTPVVHGRYGHRINVHYLVSEGAEWSTLKRLSEEICDHVPGGTVFN